MSPATVPSKLTVSAPFRTPKEIMSFVIWPLIVPVGTHVALSDMDPLIEDPLWLNVTLNVPLVVVGYFVLW